MQEQELLDFIIREQDWEQLIYNIVTIENLDPWNIDLVKLTDSFISYLRKIEELDFRIPAKVVLVAAILLKLKVDYLSPFEDKMLEFLEKEPMDEEIESIDFEALKEYLSKFKIPIKRKGIRKVTLDELMSALKKAIAVEQRREAKKRILKKKLSEEIQITEEDIEERINTILKEITTLLKRLKQNQIPFSKLVEEWNRECIIDHLIPVLHLDYRGNINCKQEAFFKEIFISKTTQKQI